MARKAHRKIFGCAMPTSGTNPTPKPIELVEVKSHVSTYDKRTGNLQETNGDWSHSQHNRYKISCMVINLYYSWSINESFIFLEWSCTKLLTNSAMFSSDTRLLQRSLAIYFHQGQWTQSWLSHSGSPGSLFASAILWVFHFLPSVVRLLSSTNCEPGGDWLEESAVSVLGDSDSST